MITRRESLIRLFKVSSLFTLSSLGIWPFETKSLVQLTSAKKGFIVEGVGKRKGYSIKELTRKVFEAAGGAAGFISRGDVVVIKPNISWASRPELAATTNPVVLEAVVELCLEAGAKKVRIVDHTIHDARRCFALTGTGAVAKRTGAELVFPRSSLMKKMKIRGHRIDVWPVFVPVVEADRLINIPVAKVHGLSTLTLGMKNWFGAIGGRRNVLHQDIHQTIVDLAQFFTPTFTLIDATRIMIRGGPSGGRKSDVAIKNTLILSDDQVASDALATKFFGYTPEEIGFIRLGQKWGLGTHDLNRLDQRRVVIS